MSYSTKQTVPSCNSCKIYEDPLKEDEQCEQFPKKGFWRSKDCHLMCEKEAEESTCLPCSEYLVSLQKDTRGD